MRKVLRLTLLSLILIISLTTICLAEEKMDLDIFDLIKHAPFFGHAFNTEEFTYIGIYYPSFIYEKDKNELTVEFKKIDDRTVQYRFDLDCPPFFPIKKQIQVEGKVCTATQPKNYSCVVPKTIYNFVGTVGKETTFNFSGKRIEECAGPDWSFQMYRLKDIPYEVALFGPSERKISIDKFIKEETPQFYPLPVPLNIIEDMMKAQKERINKASLYCPPDIIQEITKYRFPIPLLQPDQYSIKMDEPFIMNINFIRFLEIIELDRINLIAKLPFDPLSKVYIYVYLQTPEGFDVFVNRVLLRYELGL